MSAARTWLDRIAIDWTDFAEASRVSREIVETLAADRDLLRQLVLAVEKDETLNVLAEKHGELSYVVIYDALDRGVRVRVHWFHIGQEDPPHDHRYSFSSALLGGSYVHALYGVRGRGSWAGSAGESWSLEQPAGTSERVQLPDLDVVGHDVLLRTVQDAGTSYTLHHSAIHNISVPDHDAFSVFCRGPVEKDCALQLNPKRRTFRWKFGRVNESPGVLAGRRMDRDDLRGFIVALEKADII